MPEAYRRTSSVGSSKGVIHGDVVMVAELKEALNGNSAYAWIRPLSEVQNRKKGVVCNDKPKCVLGRLGCKRRPARASRGCLQIACRILDM